MKLAEKKIKQNRELNFVHLLGGKSIVTKPIRSEFDIISLSNEGITKASLDVLISHLGISKKAFSENILDTSVKTLERKKSTDKLDKRTSSHIIEIAKVLEHVFAVFESEEKVKSWLNTPNRALNSIKPIDLFYLPTGLNMVNDILGRIEEGVYS
jgi:putative toxin-antitoxin system antitoxin component (TIGR02293 family)